MSLVAIDHFTESAAMAPGAQLAAIRLEAPRFRSWFSATGMPDYVASFDLVSLPYPVRFGLFRAALTPAPFLTLTNRLVVVRWHEPDGRRRTLLFEPSDVELGRNTPFFADLIARTPAPVLGWVSREYGSVLAHLHRLGIDPNEVDFLTFDHLHTQDVRRLVGTELPQAGLSPRAPVRPWFPHARLLVQRQELEALTALHPLQRPWYQPESYRELRTEAIQMIDGDVLLGPGVALLATPGHTGGNHSLVLNTDSGIWASSENVIATECLTPEHSRIPGVARATRRMEQEVVLNANTIESTALQYNSCVKEKLIVDRSRRDHRFLQFFPSSELTPSRLNPGTTPTFSHRQLRHGTLHA